MRRLSKFWQLPLARRWLLIEAALWLLVARLALRVLPFRWLTKFFERPPKGPEVVGAERERLREEVRWAIHLATRQLPGKTVCFPRAITAQEMLRRRGVGTTLYYGAAKMPGQGVTTHVWVQDGTEGVIGHLMARGYHTLARYPEAR
jgi:transglutaminase superfamily protein